jgi:hypothetical protein
MARIYPQAIEQRTASRRQTKRAQRLANGVRSLATDRVNFIFAVVLVLASAFYCWRANASVPLELHGGQSGQYNQLAEALLHLHLWVARVPSDLLGRVSSEEELRTILEARYPDYALYGQYLYITWGPAPVVVLLIPMHLLGLDPSGSVIIMPLAMGGLGFALATLRVIVRQLGKVPPWAYTLAGLTLACASVVPYLMRSAQVYHESIAGAYCFAMIGVWLAATAVVDRRASLKRLALMSLCFGLAACSRPTLGATAVLLLPVYLSLRSVRARPGLVAALVVPVVGCLTLLALYNQARFGNPLEYGTKYQLNPDKYWGRLSYVPPGMWSYLLAPPRVEVLFPFLSMIPPQVSYPLGLPATYSLASEETGGLLAMAPIAIFVIGLPWMWWRHGSALGRLAPFLLTMAGAGVAILAFICYEFFASAERYEVDYTTLFLLGALATWLALSCKARARERWIVRAGALLAAWSCTTGLAVSLQALEGRPATWRALVKLGSPVSIVMAMLAGHPVLGGVNAAQTVSSVPHYGELSTEKTGFLLNAGGQAEVTIVSPNDREAALAGNVLRGPALPDNASLGASISGPGQAVRRYPSLQGYVEMPVRLRRGVNQLTIRPLIRSLGSGKLAEADPELPPESVMAIVNLRIAGEWQ